jgi:hypothetical protein
MEAAELIELSYRRIEVIDRLALEALLDKRVP